MKLLKLFTADPRQVEKHMIVFRGATSCPNAVSVDIDAWQARFSVVPIWSVSGPRTNPCQLPSASRSRYRLSEFRDGSAELAEGNLRRMDELHLDFPFASSRTLRDLPNAGGRGSSFQFCITRGRCRWCARARSHGVLLITKYMLDAGAFRPKLKAADKALRRLNLHQNPAETLYIRRLENGLERPGGRSRPARRHLASLVVADAFAGALTLGSIRTFPATAETENTASAGGFEPPHGGIKFRCLTDLPCSGTGRCIRRRNSSLWRPRRLDHNARRDAPLSFAQFEREGFGERIRDKIAASKRKALWVGGPVPFGKRRYPFLRGQNYTPNNTLVVLTYASADSTPMPGTLMRSDLLPQLPPGNEHRPDNQRDVGTVEQQSFNLPIEGQSPHPLKKPMHNVFA